MQISVWPFNHTEENISVYAKDITARINIDVNYNVNPCKITISIDYLNITDIMLDGNGGFAEKIEIWFINLLMNIFEENIRNLFVAKITKTLESINITCTIPGNVQQAV